ncbi:Mobile element protein (plasmid) [Rhodococcus sp. WAY2]|nr:Mobile element protein [Rhodococcus sp. WAY2]
MRTSVGLDVHARSVVPCGLDGDTGELFERRLTPDRHEILGWIWGFAHRGQCVHRLVSGDFGELDGLLESVAGNIPGNVSSHAFDGVADPLLGVFAESVGQTRSRMIISGSAVLRT